MACCYKGDQRASTLPTLDSQTLFVDNIHPAIFQTGNINGYGDNPVEGWLSGITDAKKAMTPYFTTKKTGTGLGLPIVTKIINEHNGNFSIKNKRDNKGTIIKISLPKHD